MTEAREIKGQISNMMPESTTPTLPRTIVHTGATITNGLTVANGVTVSTAVLPKKLVSGIVSVKVEPSGAHQDAKSSGTRLIHLIPAGAANATAVVNGERPATPNILKRAKPLNTAVTLAPKRPMVSTTAYVATLPSPPSSTSSLASETGAEQQQPPSSTSNDFDKSPLSLLAEEAARRTPTLNLAPSMTSDVPLDPKFIGGPIIAGKEQIDIRKSEIVCQQLSEHKLTGPYVVLIAHSHREYRGTMVKAENFEGFKEDTETMKRWPLRAWTDSAYSETQYVLLDVPKLGTHPVAIVTLKDENVINLRFPVLSSDRNNHGHKKFGRLWEQIIFPYDKLQTAYAHWVITPIQIVAELRDPTKLKKPKRPELIHPPMTLQFRQNSADLTGTPTSYAQFDQPLSDEEAEHSRQRMFLDIKKEPYEEDHSSAAMLPLPSTDEMSMDDMITVMQRNQEQITQLLRTASPEIIRMMYFQSCANLSAVREHVSRNSTLNEEQMNPTHHHNGSASL